MNVQRRLDNENARASQVLRPRIRILTGEPVSGIDPTAEISSYQASQYKMLRANDFQPLRNTLHVGILPQSNCATPDVAKNYVHFEICS